MREAFEAAASCREEPFLTLVKVSIFLLFGDLLRDGLMRLLFQALAMLLAVVAAQGASADVESLKGALKDSNFGGAVSIAQTLDTKNPEAAHLKALSIFGAVNLRSQQISDAEPWLPGEKEEIASLLRGAAEQGYAPAQRDYALFLLIDAESEDWPAETLAYMRAAHHNGDLLATNVLLDRFCSGKTVPIGENDILPIVGQVARSIEPFGPQEDVFSLAGSFDPSFAQQSISLQYARARATGGCFGKDKAEARRIFEVYANRPEASSFFSYSLGEVVDQLERSLFVSQTRLPVAENRREAAEWLSFKVESGAAKYSDYIDLAVYLVEGKNVPQDIPRAAALLARCMEEEAVRSDVRCVFNDALFKVAKRVAVDLKQSSSRRSDQRAAIRILQQIARYDAERDRPYTYHAIALAELYHAGAFGQPDYPNALKAYKLAAEAGSGEAQFQLGYMYSSDIGTLKNADAAKFYYMLAFEQGYSTAAYNLGIMYSNGSFGRKDEVTAASWHLRAAEMGNLSAIAEYGRRLADGVGVLENDIEAARWLERAANGGNAVAQFNLALMYADGEGVAVNRVTAYKWANLAGAAGNEQAAGLKSRVAARMSRDEINLAQRLSAEWAPQKGKDLFADAASSEKDGSKSEGPETDRELVGTVQRGLSELGYYSGLIDGVYGPQTKGAIEAFERASGERVTGLVTPELAFKLGTAAAQPGTRPRITQPPAASSSGSGFLVTEQGHILTNAHVVTGCTRRTLRDGTNLVMVAYDPSRDLALLSSSRLAGRTPLRFRSGRDLQVAESILVAGFPLSGLVSPDLNVTIGNVSALSGPDGSKSLIQVTAPVQPGNSGGPILDQAGSVVGVVVSKLDALAVAVITGDIPQNVNFGISLATVREFLDLHGISVLQQPSSQTRTNAEIAELAGSGTFSILCH